MATVVLTIMVIFVAGMIVGAVVLVSLASRKEDKRLMLSREAPDRMTLAGRYLTSLYVRRPGDEVPSAGNGLHDDYPNGRRAEVPGWPHRGQGSSRS